MQKIDETDKIYELITKCVGCLEHNNTIDYEFFKYFMMFESDQHGCMCRLKIFREFMVKYDVIYDVEGCSNNTYLYIKGLYYYWSGKFEKCNNYLKIKMTVIC